VRPSAGLWFVSSFFFQAEDGIRSRTVTGVQSCALPISPQRWRRRMIALGSSDPTRIICSALIAQAFETVRYPILPKVTLLESRRSEERRGGKECRQRWRTER